VLVAVALTPELADKLPDVVVAFGDVEVWVYAREENKERMIHESRTCMIVGQVV
jgi:hypothetical protein